MNFNNVFVSESISHYRASDTDPSATDYSIHVLPPISEANVDEHLKYTVNDGLKVRVNDGLKVHVFVSESVSHYRASETDPGATHYSIHVRALRS